MNNNVSIFMGLTNIAGYFSKLKIGFDELGINSYLFDVTSDPFSYTNSSEVNKYVQFLRYLYVIHSKYSNKIVKLIFIAIYKLCLFPIFIWSIFKFDVFIFGFNHSFYRLYDLPILKFFNKKIIFVYLGSDSRPPYMSGIDLIIKKKSLEELFSKTKKIKNKIHFVEKYADYVINNPASGQFHQKNFINWMCIGMPTILYDFDSNNFSSKKNEIRIIHAPTRPITKGSAIFSEIIQRLQLKYNINYIELVGKSNSEVLDELKRCDFVLDEIYSDIPIAGLSSEAAAFKKISIVAGYYNEKIKNDVKDNYLPPSLFINPSDIEENIINLIENKYKISVLGKEIFDFIAENWSSKEIANKFSMLINDKFPEEWLYNTMDNSYIYGYGISKEELKKQYIEIYNKFGIEGFQLEHNPKLEKKVIDFIND